MEANIKLIKMIDQKDETYFVYIYLLSVHVRYFGCNEEKMNRSMVRIQSTFLNGTVNNIRVFLSDKV
jgi:hypothetical protein